MYEDEDFFSDLLEAAFLEAQIDGKKLSLAYLWVRTN